MFGPLPRLHRILVLLAALAVGIVSGIWVVHVTGIPALVGTGVGWGFLAGMLLDFVLVHDFHRRGKPVEVDRL